MSGQVNRSRFGNEHEAGARKALEIVGKRTRFDPGEQTQAGGISELHDRARQNRRYAGQADASSTSSASILFYIITIPFKIACRSQVEMSGFPQIEMSRLLFGNTVSRKFMNAMEISLLGGFHGHEWDHYHEYAGARPS